MPMHLVHQPLLCCGCRSTFGVAPLASHFHQMPGLDSTGVSVTWDVASGQSSAHLGGCELAEQLRADGDVVATSELHNLAAVPEARRHYNCWIREFLVVAARTTTVNIEQCKHEGEGVGARCRVRTNHVMVLGSASAHEAEQRQHLQRPNTGAGAGSNWQFGAVHDEATGEIVRPTCKSLSRTLRPDPAGIHTNHVMCVCGAGVARAKQRNIRPRAQPQPARVAQVSCRRVSTYLVQRMPVLKMLCCCRPPPDADGRHGLEALIRNPIPWPVAGKRTRLGWRELAALLGLVPVHDAADEGADQRRAGVSARRRLLKACGQIS